MAIFHGGLKPAGAAGGSFEDGYSLRLNSADSAYLEQGNFQPTSPYTVSFWVKRSKLGALQYVYRIGGSDTLYFDSNDQIFLERQPGGVLTTRKFRDTNSWYHIVVKSTPSDATLYVNGVQEATFSSTANPAGADTFRIGRHNTSAYYLDGYLTDFHWVDGQSLGPESFGESGTYGEWKPIEYTGGHGTNGFYLPFSNPNTAHDITANGNAQHSTLYSKIGASSICFDGSGDCLTIPASNDWWDVDALTIEMWVYWNNTGVGEYLIANSVDGDPSGGYGWYLLKHTSNVLEWSVADGNGNGPSVSASGLQAGQWYHVAAIWKKSGTEMELFLDGVSQGKITNAPSSIMNVNIPVTIGANNQGTSHYTNGYVDEVRISNVARYTSNFTPSTTAFTEDVNTKLLIHSDTTNGSTVFEDSSGVLGGLGHDASANSNNFTLNNIATTDQVLDNPENNYCTFNTLNRINAAPLLKEGNLLLDSNSDARFQPANMVVSSGKWYAEFMAPSGSGMIIGVLKGSSPLPGPSTYLGVGGSGTGVYLNVDNGNTSKVFNYQNLSSSNTLSTGGVTFTSNDVLGIVLDMDYSNGGIEGAAFAYKNGTIIATGLTDNRITDYSLKAVDSHWMFCVGNNATYTVVANFGQDSTFAGNTTAGGNADSNGYGNFKYTPPMSALAMCSANLPEPAVKPTEHFNTFLWAGNNNSTRSHTGVGFQPDSTWIKSRTTTGLHWHQYDSVRGAGLTKSLTSNLNEAEGNESSNYGYLSSFDSDGFSTGAGNSSSHSIAHVNRSGDNYVSYNWKAGGAAVSNTDGSVTSQVSANTTAGFSVLTFTSTASGTSTVGHGLGRVPSFIIYRPFGSASEWQVGHKSNPQTGDFSNIQVLGANGNVAGFDNNHAFGQVSPTTSVFTMNANNFGGGVKDHVAWCFADVPGFSKTGRYEASTNANNPPFIHTGFTPSLVIIKADNLNSHWLMYDNKRDTMNPINEYMSLSTQNAEATGLPVDFVSNGFKIRDTSASNDINATNGIYLYIAFAEQPFKYTNAR